MADDPKSAITLNIKHHIPLILDVENVHYSSWAELFKIKARANQVLDHIIPPKEPVEIKDKALWGRLDAVVLQWIYGTISEDLMLTILEPDSTAQQAWERLKDIFQDNKHTRAVYLENQFSNIHLENFKNVSTYCQKLKLIADQLSGVGSPVSNQRLVLQLVAGLTDAFDNVASMIQQMDPLPPFYKARSMLTLEETRKSQQLGAPTNALIASTPPSHAPVDDDFGAPQGPNPRPPSTASSRGRGRGGRVRTQGGRGRGRGRQQPSPQPRYGSHPSAYYYFPHPQYYGPQNYGTQTYGPPLWATAPCPYPAYSPRPTPRPTASPGVLGPRPAQAYTAATDSVEPSTDYIPTDIDAALHTMTLNPPDENWYMDTGATSHMTGDAGTLTSYFNSSMHKNIVVGNGHVIPVLGHGHTHVKSSDPPLTLSNVLHAPQIIKNLIFVRRFTSDNNVSVEFDPFGFHVKDLQTGTILMRCDSTGDLYPLSSSNRSPPQAFAALSTTTWHDRLGHPGAPVLASLRKNNVITCNSSSGLSFCHGCQIGKHIKLPFYPSNDNIVAPFDIVHSDLWTSPTLSSTGHRYYLLFLDDYTNFL